MATKRSPLVQRMIDRLQKQGDYYEDVPKHWMSDEHGMERALIAYIEKLEKNQKPAHKPKGKKPAKTKLVCRSCEAEGGTSPNDDDVPAGHNITRLGHHKPYCYDCGEDHSVEKVKVRS